MIFGKGIGLAGQYKVTIRNNGRTKKEYIVDNKITNGYLDRLRDLAYGDNFTAQSVSVNKYIAIALGTGTTTEDGSSTILENETYRVAIGNNRSKGTDSRIVVYTTITYDDISANPSVTELGIFAQDTVSSENTIATTANTGLLISRINIDETLVQGDILTVTYTNTFSTV